MSFDSEERRGEGEAMTIRLGSPDFLRMFPTVVWTLQLMKRPPGDQPSESRRSGPRQRSPRPAKLAIGAPLHRGMNSMRSWKPFTPRHGSVVIPDHLQRLEITGCWANVNGWSHGVHTHPNNFLSGVYYVQTQAGADTINFHDPRVQTALIRPPVTALTADNTDQVVVRVREGTLLLFPACSPTLSIPIGAPESASASASISCSPPAPRC